MPRRPEYWESLVKMSLSKLFMLRALIDSPAHGYELARRAGILSGGLCSPTEGAVYPMLREWEAAGLVEGTWELVQGRRRRTYRLTAGGHEAFAAAHATWSAAARAVLGAGVPDRERLADHLL